jgi:membrane-associated PAP2 superfamily phosphatase
MPAPMAEPLLSGRALRLLAWALAGAALLILAEGNSGLDLWLADAMFDIHRHEFPWQHALLTEHFGHGTLKLVLTGLGALPVAAAAWDVLRRGRALAPWWRLRIRLLALCTVLVPLVVSLLKRASHSHCPWDLERYGGYQPYYRLLEHIPRWVEAGHCLPGGHASSALWLVGLAVFWLPHDARKAAAVAGCRRGRRLDATIAGRAFLQPYVVVDVDRGRPVAGAAGRAPRLAAGGQRAPERGAAGRCKLMPLTLGKPVS